MHLQLYQASNNSLVADRYVDLDSPVDGDTSGSCIRWIVPTFPENLCGFDIGDGVLQGKAGTNYYAKIYFPTQLQEHRDSSGTFYVPYAWGAPVTSPTAPAVFTPGIPGGMDGQCSCSHQTNRADPVNTATGTVSETVTDAVVPGAGVPFALARSYRSDATSTTGLVGKGWSLAFESSLIPASDKATLVDADGARVVFTKNGDGSYATPKPVRYTLVAVAGGFTVTALDHSTRTFDQTGQLTAMKDSDGRGLTLTYTSGVLSSVTDAAGRTASLDVDTGSGRLTAVTLADGRSVHYAYTGGQLTSVTGTDTGVTHYTYDAAGRLATIVDPAGNTVTQNTYDPSTGRITQQIDADNKTTTFAWVPTSGAPVGSGESDMTDPNGGIWTDVYQAGVLLNSYDPIGNGPRRTYDPQLNVTRSTDGKYAATDMTYDSHGNVISAQVDTTSEAWEYDASDRLKAHTDGRGHKTTYTYDGSSARMLSESGPAGVTSYAYTASGLVETMTEPGNRVTHYGYDSVGNLTSTTDPEGNIASATYDNAGRVTSQTDPRGNVTGADKAKFSTTSEYDTAGRLKKQTDPLGHATSYTYDDNGNVLTVTDALNHVTTYGYDKFNRQVSVTGPDNKVTRTEYDKAGNVSATIDPAQNKTSYTYDGANRLASMTSPRGNVAGADKAKFTTTFGYDGSGNRTRTVDPSGAETVTAYDALNRVISVTDGLDHTTKTSYDGNGNIATTTDARNKVTKFTYDDADRQLTSTDPLLKVTRDGYDAAGNHVSQTSPLGFVTSWTYDLDGRMRTQVDPRGNATGADKTQFTTAYDYDPAGNQTKVTDALGKATRTEYDAMNKVTQVTDPLNQVAKTDYDELGRIKKVTGPDNAVTSYTYNLSSTLATRTDDNGHTTTYGYDNADRQTDVTDPLGNTQSVEFDPDGNPAKVTNGRGTVSTTVFDGRGLPSGTTFSDSTPAVGFTYDATGQRKTVTDGTGTRTYGYDDNGQLTAVTPSAGKGAFAYTYDDAGHLSSRSQDYAAGAALDWTGTTQTVSADLNGDGITDVIRTDATNTIRTYLGRPDGTFTVGSTLTGSGTGFNQVLPIDYTGDGKIDLLAIDKSTGHLLRYNGNGAGGFAAAFDLGQGWGVMALTAGDFNGDGKQDFLAISSSANTMYFYPGNGTGGFGTRTTVGTGWATYRLISLDYNNDGKLDVLAINSTDGHLYFYSGKGDGTLNPRTDLGGGWGAMYLVPGDFNADGKTDFLARDTANNKLRFYPANGTGGFGTYILQTADWTTFGLPATGQFNAGTTLDIVATDTTNHLRLFSGDNAGHLTGATIVTAPATGNKITYTYDDDGRQNSQKATGGTTTFGYDPSDNLTSTVMPGANGYTEKRGYDRDGRLTAIGSTKGTTTLANWQLTLDDAGQPTRVDVNRLGKPDSHQYYTYDQAGRLLTDCTSATQAATCPNTAAGTTYTYDGVGNRTTATANGALTTYTYNNADQLTSTLSGTTTRPFTYDNDGNQTGAGANTYTYDANNHLTGLTTGGSTYAYTYDTDGNRTTAKTNGATARTTVWDTNYALPQASSDYNATGYLIAYYQYSPLEQIHAQTNSDDAAFYYHHDQLGSVTDLTNGAGALQTSYAYTAYGEYTQTDTATSPPANPFGYTGQYRERTTSAAGLNLRARNYDPTLGRFTTTDPIQLRVDAPYNSAYSYADNSPTHKTDPTGQWAVSPGRIVGKLAEREALRLGVGGTVARVLGGVSCALDPFGSTTSNYVDKFLDLLPVPEKLTKPQWDQLADDCEWSYGLSQYDCKKLPVFVVDGKVTPEIAVHDMMSINSGSPFLLTASRSTVVRDINRTLSGCDRWKEQHKGTGIRVRSCDEYPFASTLEGGIGAKIKDVPRAENNTQGGLMSGFLSANRMVRGDQFLVAVINVRRVYGNRYAPM
ncbi:FG-GAP-like repeat-containing protein [Streptomyces sp. CBMA29]|uniref:FG-GAP-like repeat-containing protein n=1 Tax=Streptomyces sp. CBMA29 TaxID=1896314 RepID=UPI001662012F|nr:FG-GAP-like repeat-containing protein [Streptomyces sp. CBMA29]